MKKLFKIFLLLLISLSITSCEIIDLPDLTLPNTGDVQSPNNEKEELLPNENNNTNESIDPTSNILIDGIYNKRDEVATYIYLYNKLPSNYRKKSEVEPHISNYYTPSNKLSVGGDRFYNREGLLPNAPGRIYIELDIEYTGGSRNAKRIVYSNDGLIFYTSDHYDSFLIFDTEDFTWKSY